MEPLTIGLGIAGLGGAFILRQRLKHAATVAAQDAAAVASNLKQAAGASPTPAQQAAVAAAAPAAASLVASIQAGLANGTVQLGSNGVPFQATPTGPPPTPAQVMQGLQDPTTGLVGVLPTDLITVNSSLLADSLVKGATSIPGFAPNENVLMVVQSNGTIGNFAGNSGAQGGTGPIMAISQEARLDLPAPIAVPVLAVTGVQPADAAILEAAAARLAQKK